MIYYIYNMSIPIIDINSGDTVSTMVDKINYNFTLVSLKGGGPAGIQGIQGIRGEIGVQGFNGPQGVQGSHIYSSISPDPNSMNIGDINIYDGVIQQVVAGPGGTRTLQNVTDLNLAVQSPFGISENNTINPISSKKDSPIVFGMGTSNEANAFIKGQNQNSVLHIVRNGGDFIKFYEAGPVSDNACLGNISTNGNSLKISAKNSNSLIISGAQASPTHSLQFCTDGIYVSSRTDTNVETLFGDDVFLLMATKVNNGKINDTNDTAKWAMSNGELFPVPVANADNSLGRFGNNTSGNNSSTCIDKIYLKNNANIVQTGSTELGNLSTTSLKFVSKERIESPATDTMWLTKYGIALGSLNMNANIMNGKFNDQSFSVIEFPSQTDQSAGFYIGSNHTKIVSSIVATSKIAKTRSTPSLSYTASSADYSIRGEITLTSNSNVTADNFINNRYSPIIGAIKRTDTDKNANDTLHIHGADGLSNTGCDIAITGGNTIGTTNLSFVGGDVYIAGGSALRNSTTKIDSDLRRAGNVIIGINPLNHSDIFNRKNYTSTGGVSQNSEKIPNQIGFYDINNVAIHGNKVTIDSNANFRMLTDQYTRPISSNVIAQGAVMPYVSIPDNATVSVSGVNTMLHNDPVVLSQEDVCSHQFMSGIMKRIIRIQYDKSLNTFSITSIPQTYFENSYNTYTVNDNNGSVYFITDQIWQKIGNIVNVQAYGRWFANKKGTPNLYHIKDHMFYQKNGGTSWDIGGNQWFESDGCKNKTLEKFLTKTKDNTFEYSEIRDRTINQPLTTFVLPFTIKDVNATYCYGNGNIYTESPFFAKQYHQPTSEASNYIIVDQSHQPCAPSGCLQNIYWNSKYTYEQLPTGSVVMSTPITVGCFYNKTNHNYNYGFGTDASNTHDGHGGYGALHDDNSSVSNVRDFTSSAQLYGDARLSSTVSGHIWDESRFKKTEIFDAAYGRNYIYPEMLVDFGNKQSRASNYSDVGLYMRPVIGMYTWISLNYSYCLMNAFNYNYTGMNYKDNVIIDQNDLRQTHVPIGDLSIED